MSTVPQHLCQQVLDQMPSELHTLLENGATLLVNVSGGADSDSMSDILHTLHRQRRWGGAYHLMHACLGRADWPQTPGHVRRLARALNRPLHIVQRAKGDLISRFNQRLNTLRDQNKPLLWPPSAVNRYCTSDNKRAELDRKTRELAPTGTVVNAIGLRKQESRKRAAKPIFSIRETVTTRTRTVYDWLPVFEFSREQIWNTRHTSSEELAIYQATTRQMRATHTPDAIIEWIQQTSFPFHVAYPAGAHRLSCALCFLARYNDLEVGAHFNPDTYRAIVSVEILSNGITFQPNQALHAIRPDLLTPEQRTALGYTDEHRQSAHQLNLL